MLYREKSEFHSLEYKSTLQVASHRKLLTLVLRLLEQGADVNAVGGEYGNALLASAQKGHEDVVKSLIRYGANIEMSGKYVRVQSAKGAMHDPESWFTFDTHSDHDSSASDKEECDTASAGDGAKSSLWARKFSTALQAASWHGHSGVVRTLIQAGAALNDVPSMGSALEAASRHGHVAVVQILLKTCADVDMQTRAFGTALQAASRYGHKEVVQMLLKAGVPGDWDLHTETLDTTPKTVSEHGHDGDTVTF